MSQTAAVPLPSVPDLDISSTPRLSFSRLVGVELRKAWDTRAGFWLLTSIAGLTLLVLVIFVLAAHDADLTFQNFMQATGSVQGIVLPVLGILLVTSEWGQRTNLTTFTLEPSRSRVIAAKFVAALVLGLLAILLTFVLASLATAAFGNDVAWHDVGIGDFGKYILLSELGIITGFGFGLLFLNSAAAIVLNYLLPIVFSIIASVWHWLNQYQAWVDINVAQGPLGEVSHMEGKEWAQLLTASLIWVVAPLVAGLIRISKAEVK